MNAQIFARRFSLSYFLMMIGNGIQLPFLPLWLKNQGFSLHGIAMVVAAMTAVRVVGAPVFATLADVSGRRLMVIRGCAVAMSVTYWVLATQEGFWPILLVGAFASFMYSPVFPLTEGYSVEGAMRMGVDYGRIRMWASMSFLVGSIGSGALLTIVPIDYAMVMIASAQMMTVLGVMLLPPEPPHPPHLKMVSPVSFGAAVRFLFASRFTIFFVAACLSNCSHGMLYAMSTVHWNKLGFSSFQIGSLWASAVLAEVVFLYLSRNVVQRMPLSVMLCLGLAGGTWRWTGMAFVESYWLSLPLQCLHFVSFAMAHIALMHFIQRNVPQNLRNTAQGLYSAFASGLLLSSTQWASGPIYEVMGGEAYLAMASVTALGLAIALIYFWRFNPKGLEGVAASRP